MLDIHSLKYLKKINRFVDILIFQNYIRALIDITTHLLYSVWKYFLHLEECTYMQLIMIYRSIFPFVISKLCPISSLMAYWYILKPRGKTSRRLAVPVNETTLTIILNIDGIRYAIITRLVNFNIQGPSIFR